MKDAYERFMNNHYEELLLGFVNLFPEMREQFNAYCYEQFIEYQASKQDHDDDVARDNEILEEVEE